MKKLLKGVFKYLNIEKEAMFYYTKLREIKIRLFLKSNKAKEKYIQKKFKKQVGYEINFNKEPKTFNEKIQFRKLYDHNPLYSICADKYRVRKYVKKKIGEKYLVPLLLVTDKLTEEQWDKLPNKFVAKANHYSGVQIIKDKSKANKKQIIKELNNQLKLDYGVLSLENWYSDIPRKIIVEEFLEDNIKDYKFHCFRLENKCKVILEIDSDRNIEHKRSMFDENLNKLNFTMIYKSSESEKLIIDNFIEMKKLVEKLMPKNNNYCRVDLYNVNGTIYFGEITFGHESGMGKIDPIDWDYKLGNLWNLEISNK